MVAQIARFAIVLLLLLFTCLEDVKARHPLVDEVGVDLLGNRLSFLDSSPIPPILKRFWEVTEKKFEQPQDVVMATTIDENTLRTVFNLAGKIYNYKKYLSQSELEDLQGGEDKSEGDIHEEQKPNLLQIEDRKDAVVVAAMNVVSAARNSFSELFLSVKNMGHENTRKFVGHIYGVLLAKVLRNLPEVQAREVLDQLAEDLTLKEVFRRGKKIIFKFSFWVKLGTKGTEELLKLLDPKAVLGVALNSLITTGKYVSDGIEFVKDSYSEGGATQVVKDGLFATSKAVASGVSSVGSWLYSTASRALPAKQEVVDSVTKPQEQTPSKLAGELEKKILQELDAKSLPTNLKLKLTLDALEIVVKAAPRQAQKAAEVNTSGPGPQETEGASTVGSPQDVLTSTTSDTSTAQGSLSTEVKSDALFIRVLSALLMLPLRGAEGRKKLLTETVTAVGGIKRMMIVIAEMYALDAVDIFDIGEIPDDQGFAEILASLDLIDIVQIIVTAMAEWGEAYAKMWPGVMANMPLDVIAKLPHVAKELDGAIQKGMLGENAQHLQEDFKQRINIIANNPATANLLKLYDAFKNYVLNNSPTASSNPDKSV